MIKNINYYILLKYNNLYLMSNKLNKNKEITVIDAYIKFNKQLLVFISGLSPGSGKSSLAKKLSQDFNIKLIDQSNYYIKNYSDKKELPGGKKFVNWDSDNSIDWISFNQDIEENMSTGLIISGFALVTDKINYTPDVHIHLSVSKKNNIERRTSFLQKHKYKDKYSELDENTVKLIMNQFSYPYYLDTVKRSTINKFLNTNKLNKNDLYNMTFDIIMEFVFKFLYKDRKEKPMYTSSEIIEKNTTIDSDNEESDESDESEKLENFDESGQSEDSDESGKSEKKSNSSDDEEEKYMGSENEEDEEEKYIGSENEEDEEEKN